MRVLAFDPSSTATGWAIMDSDGGLEPVSVGVIRRPETWNPWFRIRCINYDVIRLLDRIGGGVDRIVVEIPGTSQAAKGRQAYGLPGPYAAAVGMVLAESWRVGCPVVTIASDYWTAGRGRGSWGVKKERRLATLATLSSYDPGNDPGGDMGDAIMLGNWYLGLQGAEPDSTCLLHLPKTALAGKHPYTVENVCAETGVPPCPVGSKWRPTPKT